MDKDSYKSLNEIETCIFNGKSSYVILSPLEPLCIDIESTIPSSTLNRPLLKA